MPIEVAPNRIELSDLSAGWNPDAAEAAVPMNGTPEVLNLLPMPFGSELRLRNGFTRLNSGRISSLSASHYIRQVSYYETVVSGDRKHYVMCILSNGTNASANNIQIWVYDLGASSFTRIDTVGVSWTRADRDWWFAIVEGTWYAGTRGHAPVSWHPTTGYNASPMTPNVDTWVDSTSPGANEKARNYAFKKGQTVKKGTKYYVASRGIRYKQWESGQRYSKGEKVSRKAAEGGDTYWRSFECIKSHTAGSDADQPGTGANTATYWKRVRLPNILDDDGDITADWFENPIPRKTGVGAYWGGRLFVRSDDDDNLSRVQYSAPAKPEKDADIADLDWDPTDWAPRDDFDGDGGGWFDLPFTGGDGLRGMAALGNYLIFYGRWQSFVLSGTNEASWTLRKLGNFGSLSVGCSVEQDGLVYSVDRRGVFNVTDGTQIKPTPGAENVRKWLKARIDTVLDTGGDETDGDQNWFANLRAHDGFLWLSLPVPEGTCETLVYDPRTGSFWLTDLPILDMAVGTTKGTEKLFFSTAITGAAGQTPTLFKYVDDPGNEVFTDDDWEALDGSADTDDIAFVYRSAWFQFGTTRNERRIRRVWALLGGEAASQVTIRMYKNFVDAASSYVTTVTRTLTGQATRQAEYVEGAVGPSGHVSYAEGVKVSGNANAIVSLHGFGMDTEVVRTRYHRRST